MKKKRQPQSKADENLPLILRACLNDDVEGVKEALKAGASVYTEPDFHMSVAATAVSEGRVEIMRLLLEHGYDPDHVEGIFGQRPLHHLADAPNSLDLARLLISFKATVDIKDEYGFTPLIAAAGVGNLPCVKLYVEHGADPRHVTPRGKTALYNAAQYGREDCLRYLLQFGGSINDVNHEHKTPLMWASMRGDVPTVRLLLFMGADKNIMDESDYTALECAEENGHAEVVKLLS